MERQADNHVCDISESGEREKDGRKEDEQSRDQESEKEDSFF